MIVFYLWSETCETCGALGDARIPDQIADVLLPMVNVQWLPRRITLMGSLEAGPKSHSPVLTTNDRGEVEPLVNFETSIRDVERTATDELYTPSLLLEHRDSVEQVDVGDVLEGVDFKTESWLACRLLMKRLFRYYLQNVIRTSDANRRRMRREDRKGAVTPLEPSYEYGTFKANEWQYAFDKARQVHY